MIDITIPNNNEEEFITIAEKLGYRGLCFLYDFNSYSNKQEKSGKNEKIKIYTGVLADSKNIYKIKSKLKNEKVFVAAKSSDDDREIIKQAKADMVFSFEDNAKKDFIHHRASGLNQVLCKSANENDVIIGFSLRSVLNAENKSLILGRIMQNISICRKFKAKTAIASFAQKPFEMRSVHDVISLFEVLGCKNPDFLKDQDIK